MYALHLFVTVRWSLVKKNTICHQMFLLKIEQLVRVVSIYLYRLIKANETKKKRGRIKR